MKGKARFIKEYILNKVITFDTIENFWRLWNNIDVPLIASIDYIYFKAHIQPEWEDPLNLEGGKWVITLPVEDELLEECYFAWTNLLVNVMSGQFDKEQYDCINGLLFSV